MNNIIISKTPLRISFFGGGTDFKNYYSKKGYGSALSTSINKFIYVTIKKHSNFFKEKYRLNYSETEEVNSISSIRNLIIKECIKFSKISEPLYISTIADLPGSSGLGSSSSFCVGLVNSIANYKNLSISEKKLVDTAIQIEVNKSAKQSMTHLVSSVPYLQICFFLKNSCYIVLNNDRTSIIVFNTEYIW